MNTYKYITLGLIALSASGLQGMGSSVLNCIYANKPFIFVGAAYFGLKAYQRIQNAAPNPNSPFHQLTQKLRPYSYHIGGALALAGTLLYGGYRGYRTYAVIKTLG